MTLRCEIVESPGETGKHSHEGPRRTWNSTSRDWVTSTPAEWLVVAANPRLQQKRSWIMRA